MSHYIENDNAVTFSGPLGEIELASNADFLNPEGEEYDHFETGDEPQSG